MPLRADASALASPEPPACARAPRAQFGLFIVPPRQPRATELAFADDAEVAAAYAEVRRRTKPVPPEAAGGASASARAVLPRSLAELRALPIKALKQAMASLGIAATPGSEKEELVQEIAARLDASEGADVS